MLGASGTAKIMVTNLRPGDRTKQEQSPRCSHMSDPSLYLHVELGAAVYEFRQCSWKTHWQARAGVYLFICWPEQRVVYVGQTSNFASRMPGHEVWPAASAA